MKKILLVLLFALALPVSAQAEDNFRVVQPSNGQRIELPGNATIVTGGNGVVVKGDDESLLYKTLVAPYSRQKNLYVPGRASLDYIASVCGPARQDREYNRCMKEAIRSQEDLRKKYN